MTRRYVVCCDWCGSQVIDLDERPRRMRECPCCDWHLYTTWPVHAVEYDASEYSRDLYIVHLRRRPSRTSGAQVKLIPSAVRTRYLNGRHPWPDQRRDKRSLKRLGGKARRRVLERQCRAEEWI